MRFQLTDNFISTLVRMLFIYFPLFFLLLVLIYSHGVNYKKCIREICNNYLIKFITAYFGDVRKLAVLLQEVTCSNTLALACYRGEKTALEGKAVDRADSKAFECRGNMHENTPCSRKARVRNSSYTGDQRSNQSLDGERTERRVTSRPANQPSLVWKLLSVVGP